MKAIEPVDRIEALRPKLLRTALALRVHRDDASDVVQDTIWSALRSFDRFDEQKGSLETWVISILVHRASNWRRALARRLRALAGLALQLPPPSTKATAEARLTLDRLLLSLSPRQRQVIALYEIAELGADQVAQLLNLTPAGVRSIARDARARLTKRHIDDRPSAVRGSTRSGSTGTRDRQRHHRAGDISATASLVT